MTREIIDAIASDDNLGAETEFKNAIQVKVGDALEIKRKEVANTMVSQHIPEVEEDEDNSVRLSCLKRMNTREQKNIKNCPLK